MIRLTNVCKQYQRPSNTIHALRSVDLAIEAGVSLLIAGPSGSGKSTLLNVIGLLDTPSSGTVVVHGQDTKTLTDSERSRLRNRVFGFVFQRFNLIPDLPAWKNVALPGRYAGIAYKARRGRAMALLGAFGLLDRVQHMPGELSGGEEQRVAIARALFMQPEVLLADEPTGSLDTETGDMIVRELVDLREGGAAVVVVSHDCSIARRVDRTAKIKDGRLSE